MVFNLVLALIHPPHRPGALPGLEPREGLGGAIVDHDPALAGGQPGGALPGHLPAERGRPGPLEPDRAEAAPTPSAWRRCSAGGSRTCPRRGWSRRWPPLVAAGARLTLAGVLLLGAARAAGPAAAARGGAGDGRLAGPHPDGALLRGDLLGDRPRRGGPARRCSPTPTPCSWPCSRRCSSASGWQARQWAGLRLGLVGATIVVWEGPAVAAGAVARARSWWWAGRWRGASARWSPPAACAAAASPLALAGWQMTVGGVVLIGAGPRGGPPDVPGASAGALALVVGLAVVGLGAAAGALLPRADARPRGGGVEPGSSSSRWSGC